MKLPLYQINYYLDSEANYFQSKDAALKYHVKEKGENSETVLKLRDFINNLVPVYNKGQGIDSSWMRNDPRVPKYWMIKEKNGPANNFLLLSPGKRCFSGYRLALKFLIETNQPEEIIKDIKSVLEKNYIRITKIYQNLNFWCNFLEKTLIVILNSKLRKKTKSKFNQYLIQSNNIKLKNSTDLGLHPDWDEPRFVAYKNALKDCVGLYEKL